MGLGIWHMAGGGWKKRLEDKWIWVLPTMGIWIIASKVVGKEGREKEFGDGCALRGIDSFPIENLFLSFFFCITIFKISIFHNWFKFHSIN